VSLRCHFCFGKTYFCDEKICAFDLPTDTQAFGKSKETRQPAMTGEETKERKEDMRIMICLERGIFC
jgi:hypothetical protein